MPQGDVDVQLGKEMSECLRGFRVEGSLWRGRSGGMQPRALIEEGAGSVRVSCLLFAGLEVLMRVHRPSKGLKMKVYGKHDFKRLNARP